MALGERYVISQYRFETGSGTTAYDSVRKNDGTINGSGTYSTGKVERYSLHLSGTGMVNIDGIDTNVFDLSSSGQFSVECWINTDILTPIPALGLGIWQVLLGNSQALALGLDSNRKLFVKTSGALNLPTTATTALSPNTWYHVVLTYNNTAIRLYLNTVLDLTTTATFSSQTNLRNKIGNMDLYAESSFYGYIDEVKIWKGIMNSSDIIGSYNGGAGTPYVARRNEVTVNQLANKPYGQTSFGLAMIQ